MKTLMLVHVDGNYCKGPTVPVDFDTQSWAQSRRASFNYLNIVRIEEIYVS